MKKLVTILLLAIFCIAMTACANNTVSPVPESSLPESSTSESSVPESSSIPESAVPESSVPEASPAVNSGKVSDNLFDNQFSMNGTIITMPTAVKTFAPLGLTVQASKKEFKINPMTFTSGRLESADEKEKIIVGYYNLSSEVIGLEDAMLSSVTIKSEYFEHIDIVLPKGITFGSTMDEVKAAYGEPKEYTEGVPVRYENPNDYHNFYEFYFKDKVLVGFDIYVDET